MNTVALWAGYTVLTIGAAIILAGAFWAVIELWWRLVRLGIQVPYLRAGMKFARKLKARNEKKKEGRA